MPQAIIENPSNATRSVRVVLENRTYGSLDREAQTLDRHLYNGRKKAALRQASAHAMAKGLASSDGDVLTPGGALITEDADDVASIAKQKAALEAMGLLVTVS